MWFLLKISLNPNPASDVDSMSHLIVAWVPVLCTIFRRTVIYIQIIRSVCRFRANWSFKTSVFEVYFLKNYSISLSKHWNIDIEICPLWERDRVICMCFVTHERQLYKHKSIVANPQVFEVFSNITIIQWRHRKQRQESPCERISTLWFCSSKICTF